MKYALHIIGDIGATRATGATHATGIILLKNGAAIFSYGAAKFSYGVDFFKKVAAVLEKVAAKFHSRILSIFFCAIGSTSSIISSTIGSIN